MQPIYEAMREEEVKEKVLYVRKITGHGVFECKRALMHNGWDVELAIEHISEYLDSARRMR